MKVNGISLLAAIALLAVVSSFKLFATANPSAGDPDSTLAQSNSSNTPQAPPQAADRDATLTKTIEAAFGPTKKVDVTDPFYNNIVAYTITLPKDWVFEGTVLHGPGCMGLEYQGSAYRAYSPDAAFGVQAYPAAICLLLGGAPRPCRWAELQVLCSDFLCRLRFHVR